MKAVLYIIQGFIGAGKSTFSRKLAKETGAVHLNPDEWVVKMYKKEEYMSNWNECFAFTTKFLWDKTQKYLKQGQNVVFDMGFWQKKDRDYAREVARGCNADCVHYFLNVPDEILKERIIKDRPLEWAQKHLQNFDKNKKMFEMPEAEEKAVVINNF